MTEEKVKKLLDEYAVPRHIRDHMAKVASVADYIARALIAKEVKVNREILRYACLLHDLAKVCDFRETESLKVTTGAIDIEIWRKMKERFTGMGHEAAAASILRENGEPLLGSIVEKHRFGAINDVNPASRPGTMEEKILYYADKRVLHDRVVGLEDRLADGRKRYGVGEATSAADGTDDAVRRLEKELCLSSGIDPADITDKTVSIS
jgi:putative nucleotidyltransferase with HDIG domain